MKYTFLIIIYSIFFLFSIQSSLIAQTAIEIAETELYDKASDGSLRDCNRFISRYPSSKHVDDILFRRDSMMFHSIKEGSMKGYVSFFTKYPDSKFYSQAIAKVDKMNASDISRDDAVKIFRETVAGDFDKASFSTVAVKSKGKDYIFAVVKAGDSNYRLYKLGLSSGLWKQLSMQEEKKYIQFEELSMFDFRGEIMDVNIKGKKAVLFSYDNYSQYSAKNSSTLYQPRPFLRESVTALLDVESGILYSAMFSGVEQKAKSGMVIEGVSMDADVNKMEEITEMTYLLDYISKHPSFKPISEANLISDETVRWWYENNPKGARLLQFGSLPQNSSIVKQYNRQKDIKKSKLYNAALFDFRGNTIVVAYQNSTKKHILLWCEPQAVNKDKDILLNTIYFENLNTLAFFYYKGNKTYKKRLNISERRLY